MNDTNFHPIYYVKGACRNLDTTKFSSEEEKDFHLT